ncbi:MAG: (Fe-S)-binding protein [Thermoplasmata archaeon]
MSDLEDLIAEAGKCVNCGFCESVCPTLPATDFSSSTGARGRVDIAKFLYRTDEGIDALKPFYSCLDCFACYSVCPAGVNAGIVSEIGRRVLVREGKRDSIAEMIVRITKKYMNPLGVMEKCSSWADNLKFDNVKTILYTGNMYQLMPYLKAFSEFRLKIGNHDRRLAEIIGKHPDLIRLVSNMYDRNMKKKMDSYLTNIYNILKINGIKFDYLRGNEPYPGTFIYDLGYEEDFSKYAKRVADIFKNRGIKKIITIDPHTYELLKYKYPKYTDFKIEVVYYLDLVNAIKSGDQYALHEPCHFSRYLDFKDYTAKFFEAVHEDKPTRCCGGPAELLYPDISRRVSEKRYMELKNTNKKIITACPICFANLARGPDVEDISEVIMSSYTMKNSRN